MSSPDDEEKPKPCSKTEASSPKRKVHRACDSCRGRKVRCDGHEMIENRCTNCLDASVDCTYFATTKKRQPLAYVKDLEARLTNMEKLISLISPHVNRSKQHPHPLETVNTLPNKASNLLNSASLSPFSMSPTQTDPKHSAEEVSSVSDHEYITLAVATSDPPVLYQPRFFGTSSGVFLAEDVKKVKKGVEQQATEDTSPAIVINNPRRPEYWVSPLWVVHTLRPIEVDYCFPELDLLSSLIELYFTNVNIFLPLLHRPTFEESLANGLHMRDDGFGASVILVSAIACRFSEDPRIRHQSKSETRLPTCWELFHQVQRLRRPGLTPQSIYDLHVYCLAAIFLDGSAAPQTPWTLIGIGMRFVQEVGAHRRKSYGSRPSVNSELWKRAFWVLLVLDRLSSCNLGRLCALQDEDFDLDLPIDCDDEYWTHPDPEQAFKQPMGKPTQMTFFLWFIKLNQILAFALRTLYSIKKSKAIPGRSGDKWDQCIVAKLDSAMNGWAGSVPGCLRWDPSREDLTSFRQSAVLYCYYYDLQIIIHRQYSSRVSSTLCYTSMVICTNAARSCCHLLDGSKKRLGYVLNQCMRPIFVCGVVLLLNQWSAKTLGHPVDCTNVMEDVHKCQSLLQLCKIRWFHAARLGDILTALVSVGDIPIYHRRGGKDQRDYLFMHKFSRSGSSPPPQATECADDTAVLPADLFNTSDMIFGGPDSNKILADSEELIKLPSHLEEFFFDTHNRSPAPSEQDPNGFTPNSIFAQDPPPKGTQMNCGDHKPTAPIELLMYSNLLEGSQIMDWNSTTDPPNGDNATQSSPSSFPSQEQNVVGESTPSSWDALDNVWSAAPTGFNDWEDWTSYANLLNQI